MLHISVDFDRYGGTYSGAVYTAWLGLPHELPKDIDSSNVSCYQFWQQNKDIICGKGECATEAVADLLVMIKIIDYIPIKVYVGDRYEGTVNGIRYVTVCGEVTLIEKTNSWSKIFDDK